MSDGMKSLAALLIVMFALSVAGPGQSQSSGTSSGTSNTTSSNSTSAKKHKAKNPDKVGKERLNTRGLSKGDQSGKDAEDAKSGPQNTAAADGKQPQ